MSEVIKMWDFLGLLHRRFPRKLALRYFKEGQALGVLIDTTFGENVSVVTPFLEKASAVRFHLLNNTAVRNGVNTSTELLRRYGNGKQASLARLNNDAKNIKSALYPIIRQQLDKVYSVTKEFAGTVYVSALLEHNLDRDAAQLVADYVRGQGFLVVDNPMSPTYPRIPFAKYESHGHNKQNLDISSHDGLSAFDANYIYQDPKRGLIRFDRMADELEGYWIDAFNGRFTGLKVWIPPRQRTQFPNEYEFRYVEQLMQPLQRRPRVGGYRLLPAGGSIIWKPAAEDYKKPTAQDPRQGQPVLIHPSRVARATIKSLEGKKLADLPYYGTIDTRFRYYLKNRVSDPDHFKLFEANGKREWALLDIGSDRFIINIFRRLGVQRP